MRPTRTTRGADGGSISTRRRPRILVVSPLAPATFVRQDVRLLASEFDAELFAYQGRGSLPALWRAIGRSDALLVWFVGRHALPAIPLARLRRVPVAAIIGGYEVAWVPEVSHGVSPRSRSGRIRRALFRMTDTLLTVSDFSDGEARRYCPAAARKMKRIYDSVDTARFRIAAAQPRSTILSVGIIANRTLTLKGWRLFWDVARRFPDHPFVAVGPAVDHDARAFVSSCPDNLSWTGELTGDPLLHEFQRAAVYFQGSRYESFGVAVAEAMACGCIPVVARRAALPEVVGDAGFYFDEHTPEAAAEALRQALAAPDEMRAAARQRIVDHFDIEMRRSALCAVMHELVAKRGRRC